MNVPGLPNSAPHWAYGIYWMLIAVGAAMVILVPLVIKAYADIHVSMSRVRDSNGKVQRSADAAAINSAITTGKINSLSPGTTSPDIQPVVPIDTTDRDVIDAASQLKHALTAGGNQSGKSS